VLIINYDFQIECKDI